MADKKNGPNGTGSADKKNGTPAAAPPKGPKGGKAKGGMTKWDAVKKTLDDLGWDTMPLAIKDHLKKEYGIEITAHVASNYKKKLKRMAREAAGTSATKPAAPAAPVASSPKKAASASNAPASAKKPAVPKPLAKSPATVPAPPARANGGKGSGGSILLEDVLTAKDLLDRVGAGPLRTLLDGLAK